ncbi:type II toxin-antitoxin system RelE/ParE family toxin [Lentilactobacillus otakiensis]|uniref:type II toxin-antitoxin system RelE/ParE family toxin n=1 Tax=Lentilactobacillus otakiensis TaxID=481720 RepID=UPI003D179EA6
MEGALRLKFHYYDSVEFRKFLERLSDDEISAIISMIGKVEKYGIIYSMKHQVVKKLESNLFEIRIHLFHGISRSIYFKSVDGCYVISNSFIKKSRKTPQSELKKARHRRRKYNDRNREPYQRPQ